VPAICKLLDDQNSQVREQAITTLTEIYRHVGEKVRSDLARKGIPQQK
jgi:CLIP-associating protein 1/2